MNPKTKKETRYRFVEKSGKYEQVLDSTSLFRYDDKGNQIDWAPYGIDGKLLWKSPCKYKYDNKGNLVERLVNAYGNEFDTREIFKYDAKGNMIKHTEYDDSGKLVSRKSYKYSAKENKIQMISYDPERLGFWPNTLHRYKYNAKGWLIEEIITDRFGVGKALEYWHCFKYKYDKNGNRIEAAKYFNDNLEHKVLRRFDDKGNEIERATYRDDGKLLEKSLYKYDDKGNKIEEVDYKIKEKLGTVEEIPVFRIVWEYEFH